MLRSNSTNVVWVLIAVIAITFFSFFPSLFNSFIIWDDPVNLLENDNVRSLATQNIVEIFQSTVEKVYVPLPILSFAVEYHFFKYSPLIYHLDNLLLHLAVVALIFWFARQCRLSMAASAMAALLFGIHPMHVESVAWVTERKDVLYAFFYLLSLNLYARYVQSQDKRLYGLTILFGLLSVLSKPMALSLPFIFLLYDWFSYRRWGIKIFLEKIPHVVLIFPIVWITYHLNTRWIEISLYKSTLTWIWTFMFYLQKFFSPVILLPLYQLPKPVTLTNAPFAISFVLFVLLVTLLIVFRRNRFLIFAFLYYLGSIFFLLRYDDRIDMSLVADRFMYLPSLGICILAGFYFDRMKNNAPEKGKAVIFKKWGICFLGLFFLLLSFKTYHQCQIWGNEITFWSHVIKHEPTSALAYNQRGLAYKDKGKINLALADFNKALNVNPRYAHPYVNIGLIHQQNNFPLAIANYTKAIEVDPSCGVAYLDRGNSYKSMGQYQQAIEDYTRALKLPLEGNPRRYISSVYSSRGAAYLFSKQYDLALADLNQSLNFNTDNTIALDNRAIVYSVRDLPELALADYNRSLELNPHNPMTYWNRALFYYQQKKFDLALQDLQKVLAVNGNYSQAIQLKGEIEKARDGKKSR